MRTDPTDNGGLFVGRRPGTRPIHYGAVPERGSDRRRRLDALLAHLILAAMVLVCLLFWGPVELGVLWVVAHVSFLAERQFLALLVAFVVILLALLGGLVVLKALDRAWILVRRAAGVDQRHGAIGPVFAYTALVGATLFGAWMLLGGGLADSLMGPPQP
ncbi:MAG: hypothetical protein LT070_07515 [Solirubrobacteraceae bacterium]|nr:hypothetical protein [Solirubrobacteraceae bacterium]